jgi:hypothetical protein
MPGIKLGGIGGSGGGGGGIRLGPLPNPGGAFASPWIGQQIAGALTQLPNLVNQFITQQMNIRKFKQQMALGQLQLQQGQVDIQAAKQRMGLSNLQYLTNIGNQSTVAAQTPAFRNEVDKAFHDMGITNTSFAHNPDGSINVSMLGTTPEQQWALTQAMSIPNQMGKLWGLDTQAALNKLQTYRNYLSPEQYQQAAAAIISEGQAVTPLKKAELKVLAGRFGVEGAEIGNYLSQEHSRTITDALHEAGIDKLNYETFYLLPQVVAMDQARTSNLLQSTNLLIAKINSVRATGFETPGQAANYALRLRAQISALSAARSKAKTIAGLGPDGFLQSLNISNPGGAMTAGAKQTVSSYSSQEQIVNDALARAQEALRRLEGAEGQQPPHQPPHQPTPQPTRVPTAQPTSPPGAFPTRPRNVPANATHHSNVAITIGKRRIHLGSFWRVGKTNKAWDDRGNPVDMNALVQKAEKAAGQNP